MILGAGVGVFAKTPFSGYLLIGFGVVGIFVVMMWQRIVAGSALGASARLYSSDFRVWLGLLTLVGLYAAVTQVILTIQRDRYFEVIENDMIPFRHALERWVLPRRLTPEQIRSIADHLLKYQPYAVTFRVARHDEEASGYRSDLQQAITSGHWTVTSSEQTDDVRYGLRIEFRRAQTTQQRPGDPRNPPFDRILLDALRKAGVQIDGTGTSSVAGITEDVLLVDIGRRRRDEYGHRQRFRLSDSIP
jgi:hypothetical protein